MAHDVFISHSTKDKTVSDAVCAALENAGVRCWIAPRDVLPGRPFPGEITRGIENSKAMVLVFSAHSNNSEDVLREVQLANVSHLHIIQFRIEEVLLSDDLKYFLSTPHWLDALTPPLQSHLERLVRSIKVLLSLPAEQAGTPARSTETQPRGATQPEFVSASSSSEKRDPPARALEMQEVSTAGKALLRSGNRGRRLVFAAAGVALLTAGIFVGWRFEHEQPRKDAERQSTAATKIVGPDERRRMLANASQLIVGTWRYENAVLTYEPDGTVSFRFDNGIRAKANWRIDDDVVVFSSYRVDNNLNQRPQSFRRLILQINDATKTTKSLDEDDHIWHATRVK
jgi:hypothetical protein